MSEVTTEETAESTSGEESTQEETTTVLTDQEGSESQESTAEKDGEESGESTPRAPEKYELKMPEGVELDEALFNRFEPALREIDLDNEQANKLAAVLAEARVEEDRAAAEAFQAEVEGWLESSRKDDEFGGDKFAESASEVSRLVGTYGTPELKKMLNTTGVGNHPELIRVFHRIAKAIPKQDAGVDVELSGSSERSIADRLYGNTKT